MDVSVEPLLAQHADGAYQAIHGVVWRSHQPGTQKQAFDVIASIKIDGQRDNVAGGERGAGNVVAAAVDAISAIVNAVIGVEDFEQADAAAVQGVGVADPRRGGIAQAPTTVGAAAAAGRAGDIVFGRIGQNGQFLFELHIGGNR
jgi:hypothetical protein